MTSHKAPQEVNGSGAAPKVTVEPEQELHDANTSSEAPKETDEPKPLEPTAEEIAAFYKDVEEFQKAKKELQHKTSELEANLTMATAQVDSFKKVVAENKKEQASTLRRLRAGADLAFLVFGSLSLFSAASYVFLPPELTPEMSPRTSLVISLISVASFTITFISLGFRILQIVASRPLALQEMDAGEAGRTILARSANNCEQIASQHLERSRFYLTAGAVTAAFGFVAYVLAMLATVPRVRGHREMQMLQRATANIALQINLKKADAEDADRLVDTAQLGTLLERAERLTTRLEGILRKGEGHEPGSLSREILGIARLSLAFLFVEVLAGFLLTLAQRNDIQASHWRAHRQVYERLLGARDLLKELKEAGFKEDSEQELMKVLLAPIAPTIFTGKNDANPSLEAITAMADLIQRAKDAAKDVAKDASKDAKG